MPHAHLGERRGGRGRILHPQPLTNAEHSICGEGARQGAHGLLRQLVPAPAELPRGWNKLAQQAVGTLPCPLTADAVFSICQRLAVVACYAGLAPALRVQLLHVDCRGSKLQGWGTWGSLAVCSDKVK
jgi:hypothetical protein